MAHRRCADTRQKARAFRRNPVEIAIDEALSFFTSSYGVTLWLTESARCGHRFSRPSTRPSTSGHRWGTAVLKGIAAATTETMLRARAPRAEALVHGYPSAAVLCGTGLGGRRGGRDLESYPN